MNALRHWWAFAYRLSPPSAVRSGLRGFDSLGLIGVFEAAQRKAEAERTRRLALRITGLGRLKRMP